MDEKILDKKPGELTSRECSVFSSNSDLKKKYEDKWKIKNVCK